MRQRALVVYGSRRGSTEALARAVADSLVEAGLDCTCEEAGRAELADGTDLVVVGGAIYNAMWNKDCRRFLKSNRDALAKTRVAVFGSGPIEDTPTAWTNTQIQFKRSVGRLGWLQPVAAEVFGGVDSRPGRTADLRDWDAVSEWARTLVGVDG